MILSVRPADILKGSIDLPSSKSYTIRAFLIASCGGTSRIINPSDCDDAKVAMAVACKLGSRITRNKKNSWKVEASFKKIKYCEINVGESGTVLRFVLPLLALKANRARVIGEGTLRGRPNLFLTETLRQMGVRISGQGKAECVPIEIKGGHLCGGNIKIKGTLSSQFISSLLTAAPLLKENTRLTITGKYIVSKTFIAMTEQILKKAGIRIAKMGQRSFLIKGNQKFKGLKIFKVPSDYGLAAFFLAAAALIQSNLILKGFLTDNFIPSDREILDFLRKMGVRFQKVNRFIEIRGPFALKGGNFSLKDCPDLVPIMTVVALFAKGTTRLCNIGHVRLKESNRMTDLKNELSKIGADIREHDNELVIYPKPRYKYNILLDPHQDHRLAMSFAVLGLKIGTRIKDIECTSKSYPQFVKDLRKIGASISGN